MGLCSSNAAQEPEVADKPEVKKEAAAKTVEEVAAKEEAVPVAEPVRTSPEEEEKKRKEAQAAQQRRRLSVAPNHVGDVSTNGPKPEEAPEEPEEKAPAQPAAAAAAPAPKGADFEVCKMTEKGFVPYNSKKVNQDRYIIMSEFGGMPNVALFAVMDGHGEFGHLVAEFVADCLPETLLEVKDRLISDTEAAMIDATEAMAAQLDQNNGINTSFSGTTLVFALKIDRKIYVGNVGDSRCVLLQKDRAIPLSRDQKPDNPEEKERIERAGGRVEPLPGPPGEDNGPDRVWLAEVDVPGLAMSRSIGDQISHSVGVISTPEVTVHDMTDDDRMLILASDGVWEFISDQEACDIVTKQDVLQNGACELVRASQQRWRSEEEVIDDITCVVVQFK